MTYLLIILCLIILFSMKFNFAGINEDYISKNSIEPIKGIFLMMVFFTHFVQYIPTNDIHNQFYMFLRSYHGQLIVAPFLFYSGYGICESIKSKGYNYVKELPHKRILKVLFDFDIAVLLFYLLSLYQNHNYSVKKMLLTFLGWDSIGNSNWYIFAVLFLYLFTYLAFSAFDYRTHINYCLCMVAVLSVLFSATMALYKDGYWYNTVYCYVAGMIYSAYRPKIEKEIFVSDKTFYIVYLCLCFGFVVSHKYWNNNDNIYQLTAVLFALLVVLFTAKVKISNKLFAYLGRSLFSLYILQRIPMQLFKGTAITNNIYIYFVVCFIITIVIAEMFNRTVNPLWNKLHKTILNLIGRVYID